MSEKPSIARLVEELRYLNAVLRGAWADLRNPNGYRVKRGRGQRRNRRNR